MTVVRSRFAPSPTGYLHLGHAFSAIIAHDFARAHGGQFILRIEDIDHTRCRPQYEQAIYDDLAWLGLHWEQPVLRQSEHIDDYARALEQLRGLGVLYADTRTRKGQAEAALSAPQDEDASDVTISAAASPAWRLSLAAAKVYLGSAYDDLHFPSSCPFSPPEGRRWPNGPDEGSHTPPEHLSSKQRTPHPGPLPSGGERGVGRNDLDDIYATRVKATPETNGDVILGRKDIGVGYHLAVVIDDARQGISDVVRGEDLFDATHTQVLLQALLGLPTPSYHHHKLLLDDQGRRLAKRKGSKSLRDYRAEGLSPDDVRALMRATDRA